MFLEENGLLDETQASFRKHYSTTDQIYLLHSLIGLIMKRRNIMKLFCAFIDLIAVFDSVWWLGVWQKLLCYVMLIIACTCIHRDKNNNSVICWRNMSRWLQAMSPLPTCTSSWLIAAYIILMKQV